MWSQFVEILDGKSWHRAQVEDHQWHLHPWRKVLTLDPWSIFWSAVIHKFCSYIKGLRLICHSMFSCSFCLNLGLKMFILRLFWTKHLNSIENYLASLVLLVPSSFSKTLCDFQSFSLHTFSRCFASPRKLTAEVGITFLMETQTISAWHQVALNEDIEPTQRRSEDCIVNSVALSFVLHMDEPLS